MFLCAARTLVGVVVVGFVAVDAFASLMIVVVVVVERCSYIIDPLPRSMAGYNGELFKRPWRSNVTAGHSE